MENENMTPIPEQQVEQPVYEQVEQPAYQPVEQPEYQPVEQPTYQPVEQPAYQPVEQPEYQPPVQPQYQPPVQPQYQPEPPKKRTAKWKIIVPIVAGVLALAILAGVYFLFLRKNADGVVGAWRFDGGYINDAYVAEADAVLHVYEDQTAALVINGEETALTWKAAEGVKGEDRFDAAAEDGTTCVFRYFTDPDDPYCGDLLLYRNDGNMLYFIR